MANKSYQYYFVLIIPILNIVATITTNYFPPISFNPGSVRAIIILSFALWMLINQKFEKNIPNNLNFLFIFYLFILVFFSSDVNYSFYVFLKVAIASLMFSIAFHYVTTLEILFKLHISFFITLFLIILNVIISNAFSLGRSDYLEDSFYFGEAGVNLTKNIAVIILISTIFFDLGKRIKNKQMFIVLLTFSAIILIIGLKRSSLLGLAFGLGSYLLFTPNRTKTFIYYFIGLLILFLFYPYYSEVFQDRFRARQENTVMSVSRVEEEGRVYEIKEELASFSKANVSQKLFGRDIFLNRRFYGRYRMLHIDFVNLLSGSGIVGLSLFLSFYISIYFYFRKYYHSVRSKRLFQQFNSLIISLFVLQFIMSIAGTIQGIELRGTILFYLGAVLGVIKNEVKAISKKNFYSCGQYQISR